VTIPLYGKGGATIRRPARKSLCNEPHNRVNGPSLDDLKPDKAKAREAVRKGVGVMPPYAGKLTPEQIEAVASYVAEVAGK
jgi:hypothetical protein